MTKFKIMLKDKFRDIFLSNIDSDKSWFSRFSALSLFSVSSVGTSGGILAAASVGSLGSSLSVASAASSLSILSVGSVSSILSIGSTNCVAGMFKDCNTGTTHDAIDVAFISLLNILIPLFILFFSKLLCCGLRHIKIIPASGMLNRPPAHLRVREVQARTGTLACPPARGPTRI